MDHTTILFSEVFLILGALGGWIASERYHDHMNRERHTFEELFEQNPHPELYNEDGSLNRGEYMSITFEPGYDPEEFDPEDLFEGP